MPDFSSNKIRSKGISGIIDNVYSKRNVHNIPEIWGFVVIAVVILLSSVTKYNLHENLPTARISTNKGNAFNAERAWKDLTVLTSFGPRPIGTYSNEVLAVDFLKREISFIKQTSHKNQRIEMDIQVVSGSYFWTMKKLNGMTSVYRNIQNIAVKLYGKGNSTLLINCHFDSVPGSPGASDDAASCVVMLEILRVLSRKSDLNQHTIIFLFNGAEETGLQASHGFITQHKWANDIKAFINLESVGSGGKEVLFQSSPYNMWLIKLYGKSVPHPSAQVAAEEIFQSGLIPSDTDFRIFQNYGKIPGLDFAHYINGYRYHTKYDHIDYLCKRTLQHTGDNILALSQSIANSPFLNTQIKTENNLQVFYDVLGLFFVHYSMQFAIILNYITVCLAVLIPYFILSRATKGINKKHLRYEIFLGFLINMISLVSSNAICYAIAYDLDLAGKSMTWYANTYICLPTYCLVTVFVQSTAHILFGRVSNKPLSLSLQTQARLIGTCFFWSILAAALTGAGIRTAYVIIIPLLITLISHLIIGLFALQNSIRIWLYVHLVGQVFVVLWATNLYHMVIDVFIPTAGRAGGNKNPDILIAIICSTLTFFATSYLTPLIILFKKCKSFLISLFAVYIITRFYLIAFTFYGFPYADGDNGPPKVQRHAITHAIRTLYDKDGHIRYTDSGFWMLEFDRNARKTIESLTMPEEPIPQEKNILCKSEAFCGLPLLSVRQLMIGGYWVPGPVPLLQEVANLKLISHNKTSPTVHRLHFLLTGNYLISLQIRVKDSVRLTNWNLANSVPPETIYNNQKAYFVMITHGLETNPMNITLDFKTTTSNFSRSLVDITLVTFHVEYHKEHTPVFANMLLKFPRWAYAIPSVASLQSWTF